MRLAVCSDPHIGNHVAFGREMDGGVNRRGRLTLETLDRAVTVALREGCQHLLILGDVFDRPDPPPVLITRVQQILARMGSRPIVLVGNHDRSSHAPDDSAVSPLYPVAIVVSEPSIITIGTSGTPGRALDCWCCPPGPISTMLEGLEKRTSSPPFLIALHAGILMEDDPPFLQTANTIALEDLQEIAVGLGARWVASGDWHRMVIAERAGHPVVVQAGTLCPTGFDDVDPGHLLIFDSTGKTPQPVTVEIPGPRFITMDSAEPLLDDETVASWRTDPASTYFVRFKAIGAANAADADRRLGALQRAGKIADYRIESDTEGPSMVETIARFRGRRLDEIIAEATARWVEDSGRVPAGVDKAAAKASILRFLGVSA